MSGTVPVAEVLFIESKQVFMWRIFGARLSWVGSGFRDMGLTDNAMAAYREVDENWCAWLAATGLQPKEN